MDETRTEQVPETDAQTVSPETDADDAIASLDRMPEPEPELETEPEPDPEPEPDADADPDPEPASDSEPASDPEPASQDESSADADEDDPDPTLKAHRSVSAEPPVDTTMRIPQPAPDARPTSMPTMSVETPRLADIFASLGAWFRARAAAIGSHVTAHRAVLVIAALGALVVLVALVAHGLDATWPPADELVLQDARDRLAAPSHTPSDFAAEAPLILQNVEIEGRHRSDSRDDACDVDVDVTFTNAFLETTADATLTYVREDGNWVCVAATTGNASHRALTGVSQEQVLAHADQLFQEADTATDGRETLASLYRDAHLEVTSESFDADAQTDALTLHCTTTGTFVSYECDLTAHFRFIAASGAWELANASTSSDAYDLGLSPLVGTWQGSFASQSSSSAKCLAGQGAGLTIQITQAAMTGSDNARIAGTLTGIAHLHETLSDDATSTEGDLMLEDAPFSGTLAQGTSTDDLLDLLLGEEPQDPGGIVFDCLVQDQAGGNVELELTFGTPTAPDAAYATLTSTHRYTDTVLLLFPYERMATFTDRFTLEKRP